MAQLFGFPFCTVEAVPLRNSICLRDLCGTLHQRRVVGLGHGIWDVGPHVPNSTVVRRSSLPSAPWQAPCISLAK